MCSGWPATPVLFPIQAALLGGAGLGAALTEGARVGQRWGRVSAAFGGGRAAARWGGASERLSSVLAASAATLYGPGCSPSVTWAAVLCNLVYSDLLVHSSCHAHRCSPPRPPAPLAPGRLPRCAWTTYYLPPTTCCLLLLLFLQVA